MSIIVDKRLLPKNQATGSRQRFLERYKQAIKKKVQDIVIKGTIKGTMSGSKKIKIKMDDLDEPSFEFEQGTGKQERVYVGNKKFKRGDQAQRPSKGGLGKGQKAGLGKGEDDFEFTLTEEEFRTLFFEDLELPNLVKKHFMVPTLEVQHAGFSRSGGPTSLNIRRTMINALGRRLAMRNTNPHIKNLTDEELKGLLKKNGLSKHNSNKGQRVQFIEDMDLRYNFKEKQEVPTTKAVMFALLDVSGSMGEKEKDIAKRFFILLNLFLQQNYQQVDIVYVRHTDDAEIVDEEKFFYDRLSGGTVISSGYEVILKEINQKYNPESWNIYIAQASDGDNFPDDMDKTKDLLINSLLPKTQYLAYIDVISGFYRGQGKSLMFQEVERLQKAHNNIAGREMQSLKDIWPVFKSLFERKKV